MQVCAILEKIIEIRLNWLGSVIGKDSNSVAHYTMLMSVPGTRRRSRPKKRWTNHVRADMNVAGLTEADLTNFAW